MQQTVYEIGQNRGQYRHPRSVAREVGWRHAGASPRTTTGTAFHPYLCTALEEFCHHKDEPDAADEGEGEGNGYLIGVFAKHGESKGNEIECNCNHDRDCQFRLIGIGGADDIPAARTLHNFGRVRCNLSFTVGTSSGLSFLLFVNHG